MRNDLTPAFLAEMAKDTTTPIQLMVVRFQSFDTMYLSDRDVVIDGQLYEALVEDWGDLSTVGAENAISSTMTMTVTLWNGDDEPFSSLFHNEDPMDVFVDIYQTYEGLATEDMALIGEFVIQDPLNYTEASSLVGIELVSVNMRYFSQVGKLLTRAVYPDALESDLNKPINLIIGNAGRVQCLCSKKPKVATMDGSILKAAGFNLFVHEDLLSDDWDPSGYIQVGDETLRYSSIDQHTLFIVERGCFQTDRVDHGDGSQIVHVKTYYGDPITSEYLAGEGPLTSILDVRVKDQVPTVSYTVDELTGRIIFESAPTYVEFSRSTRRTGERFDNTNGSTCGFPNHAIDDSLPSSGALISRGATYGSGQGGPLLQVEQLTPAIEDGEVVNIFLVIKHWATRKYTGTRVDVDFEGLGVVGFLARPDAQDETQGDVTIDLSHEHDHLTGGDHEHDSLDPDFGSVADPHTHSVSETEGTLNGTNYGQNETKTISGVNNSEITQRVDYNWDDAGGSKLFEYAKILIRCTNGTRRYGTPTIPSYITVGGFRADWFPEVEGFVFHVTTENYVDIKGWLFSGNYGGSSDSAFVQYKVESVVVHWTAAKVKPSTIAVTTSKRVSGDVNRLKSGFTVKDSDDVVPLTEAQETVLANMKKYSSKAVEQKFDLTADQSTATWEDMKDKTVKLTFININNSYEDEDYPEIVVTDIKFEVEYRQRSVKISDDITCEVVGNPNIDPRPDDVIRYLLHNIAGVPLEKFSSVFRFENVWDDTDIWNDEDTWKDGGQITGVPAGAYFEEAAAWFAFRNYRIDGVIPANINIKDAVQNVTWQTRSRLLWQNGKCQLTIKRKQENWTIVDEIETNDIQLKSYKAKRSPIDSIVNDIELFYSIDRLSLAQGSEQYGATATETDAKSIEKHGVRKDDSQWLFNLVRSPEMAEDIASYYIWELGETSTFYTFDAYLSKFYLQKDDYVKINSYRFDNIKSLPAVVRELTRRFGSGKLGKINTLQMVAQVIRYHVLQLRPEDFIKLLDDVALNMGFENDYDDKIFLSDIAEIVTGKEFFDTVTLQDILFDRMAYNSSIVDTVSISDSLSAHFELDINDEINLQDIITFAREYGFGIGPFGLTPFGAQTVHNVIQSELVSLNDEAIITLTTA